MQEVLSPCFCVQYFSFNLLARGRCCGLISAFITASICRHAGSVFALVLSYYTVNVSRAALALAPTRARKLSLAFHTGNRDTAGEAGVPLRVPGRDTQGVAERVLSLLAPEVRQVRHEVQASPAYQEPEGNPLLSVLARSFPSRLSVVRVSGLVACLLACKKQASVYSIVLLLVVMFFGGFGSACCCRTRAFHVMLGVRAFFWRDKQHLVPFPP